jgi:hypothetical protein
MSNLTHVRIEPIIFQLQVRGLYEASILSFALSFEKNGLRESNMALAGFFNVDKRTVEKAISRLKKQGLIAVSGKSRTRCIKIDQTALKAVRNRTQGGLKTELKAVGNRTQGGTKSYSGRFKTALTADHKERKNKKKEKEGLCDSEESRLALFLFTTICEIVKPDFKKPNLQNWAKGMRRILDDARNPEQIKRVIQWGLKHHHWHDLILCPMAL